ncbi:LuxR C-terminal-related transcriptional regulator (plasmid) [Rhodococcus pyridinivorans]|uniref:helix-turn-helix transcriptional regulator n=1 Tax=Rhodococcus pyridinivorans TaxID=103816 RepID=UPI0020C7302E|nr:LuxR C-terminal-related transcriptional regulator [Rhodococcus pyridinivorans]UTM40150.1 LuxR C-terminal-related transcriptional regulator [Rhodococcus pyridinivorans]
MIRNRLHEYRQSIRRLLAETQCLLETEPIDELQVLRCRDLLEEATVLAAEASSSSHRDERVHHLTPREQEVAVALSTGQSNYEIAADLFISVNTVRFHIRNILRKLDAKNRSEVAAIVSRWKTHVLPDGSSIRYMQRREPPYLLPHAI